MELRATIRAGKVTLVPIEQVIVEGGAIAVLARAAITPEVTLADISWDEDTEVEDREPQAEFLANDNAYARRALKLWARAVGHRRLWFPDEVYEPSGLLPARRVARTSCRCCGLEMSDGSESFWDMVQGSGFFPPFCFCCGTAVPQWSVPVPVPRTARTRRLKRIRDLREIEASSQSSEMSEEGGGVDDPA